jgi:hypothetical protein
MALKASQGVDIQSGAGGYAFRRFFRQAEIRDVLDFVTTVFNQALPGRVFPAHAGMNRARRSTGSMRWCVPRARGDEPVVGTGTELLPRCSPRTRG